MMKQFVISLFVFIAATAPVQSQQYRQLTDVPTVYIETENHQPITSKEEYILCKFTYVDGEEVTSYEQTQIRGRGNSSWWNSEKKPYRIKFNKKQELLGPDFAKAKSWTLLANHGDKTMIRNALTYYLGRFMDMKFCPAAKFVDLYLNGEYRGTYQISDHVQVHEKRVDIDEADGWFLEVTNDNAKEDPYITTLNGIMYNVKNPEDDDLTVNKRIAIGQWINKFESAVLSENFTDPETGYRAFIDEDDFINWYVGAEITGNIDALFSIYMYKDADEEKMHFGPLWDIDLGYDNSSERSLQKALEAFLGLTTRPFEKIMQRIWQDPWFAYRCSERMNQLIDNGLEQYLLNHIEELRNTIFKSQQKNFTKWPINQPVYSFEKHVYHNTYDEYIIDLKENIRTHIPYLQQEFTRRRNAMGIQETVSNGLPADACFDLSGRRIYGNPSAKNIYIQNNRKIIRP